MAYHNIAIGSCMPHCFESNLLGRPDQTRQTRKGYAAFTPTATSLLLREDERAIDAEYGCKIPVVEVEAW
jgi:hypothetical protein